MNRNIPKYQGAMQSYDHHRMEMIIGAPKKAYKLLPPELHPFIPQAYDKLRTAYDGQISRITPSELEATARVLAEKTT